MSCFFCLSRSCVRTAGFLLAITSMPPAFAGVEVFSVAGDPVTNVPPDVVVVELDELARLDARFSEGLPHDPLSAESEAQHRMNSPEWNDLIQQYGLAAQGVARAWMLRIEKVPAVVLDGRYVIYGEHDVAQAVADLRQSEAVQ